MTSDHDLLMRVEQQLLELIRRVEKLERQASETAATLNRARGGWLVLMKIGLVLATLIGALWALWSKWFE